MATEPQTMLSPGCLIQKEANRFNMTMIEMVNLFIFKHVNLELRYAIQSDMHFLSVLFSGDIKFGKSQL